MSKELLGDTDYTSGKDNRFGVTAAVARVSKIEVSKKGANVRVIMPDRVDHNDNPLISKPIPVLQIASRAKKSFAVPRVGDNVYIIKMPNGTSNYAVLGSFYTKNDPPPVTDPMLDYTEYDDGSTMQFDASKGELTWKIKGNCLIENEKDFVFKLKGNFTVEIDGDILLKPKGKATIDAQGDVAIKSAGQTTIESPTINLKGNIQHTGDMQTTGTHTDVHGLHTGAAARESELEARVAALEERLRTLGENR